MKKNTDHPYEGHLTLKEISVPAGAEWTSRTGTWSVIHIQKGTGYYLQPRLNQALDTGSVLLIPGGLKASLRASQLSEMAIHTYSVAPARLTGLITMTEQAALELAAARKESTVNVLPPGGPASLQMAELCASQKKDGLPFRLKLLQLFVEIVGADLDQVELKEEALDAKRRLELFLKNMPPSELLELDFNELARQTHCTARHLGRIFYQLVGMSFRDKRAAIRLERARELLATTDSKIVDVAMESGFKSLSLFNLLFARHFGVSPGKWRQKQEASGKAVTGRRVKLMLPGNRPLFSGQINAQTVKAPEISSQKNLPPKNAPTAGKAGWKNSVPAGLTAESRRLTLQS